MSPSKILFTLLGLKYWNAGFFPPDERNAVDKIMLCDLANALLAFSTAMRSQWLPGCHADLPNQAAVRPASFCSSSSFRFSQRNPRLSKDTMVHQHIAKVYSIETA